MRSRGTRCTFRTRVFFSVALSTSMISPMPPGVVLEEVDLAGVLLHEVHDDVVEGVHLAALGPDDEVVHAHDAHRLAGLLGHRGEGVGGLAPEVGQDALLRGEALGEGHDGAAAGDEGEDEAVEVVQGGQVDGVGADGDHPAAPLDLELAAVQDAAAVLPEALVQEVDLAVLVHHDVLEEGGLVGEGVVHGLLEVRVHVGLHVEALLRPQGRAVALEDDDVVLGDPGPLARARGRGRAGGTTRWTCPWP